MNTPAGQSKPAPVETVLVLHSDPLLLTVSARQLLMMRLNW
jgi:hypothetical protein